GAAILGGAVSIPVVSASDLGVAPARVLRVGLGQVFPAQTWKGASLPYRSCSIDPPTSLGRLGRGMEATLALSTPSAAQPASSNRGAAIGATASDRQRSARIMAPPARYFAMGLLALGRPVDAGRRAKRTSREPLDIRYLEAACRRRCRRPPLPSSPRS